MTIIAIATLPWWIGAFIYRPVRISRAEVRRAAYGVHAIPIDIPAASGGALSGWWYPAPVPGGYVVMLVHGRSGDITGRSDIATGLRATGFGVLLFDYAGYGASTGSPSEAGLTADTAAAYDWLRRHGIARRRIVILGQSLGDAPAAAIAARHGAAALVLVSPFTDLPAALHAHFPWLPLDRLYWPRNRFVVATRLAHVDGPILFVASDTDGMVPIANAEAAAAAAAAGRPVNWLRLDGHAHDGLLGAAMEGAALPKAIRTMLGDGRTNRTDNIVPRLIE